MPNNFHFIPVKFVWEKSTNINSINNKLIVKFIYKCKGPKLDKTSLRKSSKDEGLTLQPFQDLFKATVTMH